MDRFNVNNKGLRENDGATSHGMRNSDLDWINSNSLSIRDMYYQHINYLLNIATNLHTFDGLPKNPTTGRPIRSSFFETMLVMGGSACIARTEEFGLVVSPCTVVGTLDIYGDPNKLRLVSSSSTYQRDYSPGLNIEVEKGDFAFFRNDNMRSSLYPLIVNTAKQLTVAMYGMDKNIGQQKFPNILRGTTDTKLTVKHGIAQIDGYQPYIVIKDDSSFNPENSKVFNTNLPYVADKMYASYTDILNNFFMRIGVNILPNAKKERMLVDEINSNNQAIRAVSDVYLNNRIEGCECAKALFPELAGLSVRRNNEFITTVEESFGNGGAGDE